MVISKHIRKRAAPQFFCEEFAPKKQSTKPSYTFIFLAVKTDDDPDGFYLCRARRSNYIGCDGLFAIHWLTKQSRNIYKLDFSDQVHSKTVISEVEVQVLNSTKFRLPDKERRRITSDGDDDGSSSDQEEEEGEDEEEADDVDEEEAGSKKSPKRKAPTGGKKSAGKTGAKKPKAAKEKKEKPKKPKRVAKNKFVPNDELVRNEKVKMPSDDGFLSQATTTFVSGLVSSKLLIRAVLRNDAKLVQQLVNDGTKCPLLNVTRSVDMEDMDALTTALQLGNLELVKIIAKELYSKLPKKRAPVEQPLLSSISSGVYNFRSLGIPIIRDVMMSRGGREGINALTQDEGEYNKGSSDVDYSEMIVRRCVPLAIADELSVAIRGEDDQQQPHTLGLGRGRGHGHMRNGRGNFYENFLQKIDYVMIHGHWELAGYLVEKAKASGIDTFNYLHVGALTKKDVKECGVIRAASVTKKTMRNMNISPLHCAAVNPNPQFLQEFLKIAPDYNITDKRGRRPIHFAAACQSSGPLKILLASAVPYIEPDASGNTPLMYAAIVGRTENVRLLLEQSKKDKQNQAAAPTAVPAKKAARMRSDDEDEDEDEDHGDDDGDNDGEVEVADASAAVIAKYGPCAINKVGRDGKGAIHHAAANNFFEIVKLLVQNGADCDMAAGSAKQTALMAAASQGHLDIVKFLVEEGNAAIERRDRKMRTALLFAVKNGHAHITAYLLRLGADPNTADSSDNKAIHYAAAYGWLECFNLLITAGAQYNVDNDWSMTPLAVSFLKGHIGITRELLKQPDADINFRDKNGRTLVMLTCQAPISEPLFEQLKFLINQMKADATLADIYGCNALHFLATSAVNNRTKVDNPEALRNKMASLLLDAGCSPSAENSAGLTPVSTAINAFNSELVGLLLNRGGKMSVKPDSETLENSFHVMAKNFMSQDFSKILQQLKSLVDAQVLKELVNARNREGLTPLLLAAQCYSTASPPYNVVKDTKEFEKWHKDGVKFLRVLVDDFGANVEAASAPGDPKPVDDGGPNSSDDDDNVSIPVLYPDPDNDPDSDDSSNSSSNNDQEEENNGGEKSHGSLVHFLLLPRQAPPAIDFIKKYRPTVDLYDKTGETPAITVAAKGTVDSMNLLIELNANLNATSKEPPSKDPASKGPAHKIVTPLLNAAVHKTLDMMICLVKASQQGKKIDLTKTIPSSGDSVLSILCTGTWPDVDKQISCLNALSSAMKNNFDVNFKTKSGRTLLMLAIGTSHRQVDSSAAVEKWLLAKGADCAGVVDNHGRTALHWVFLTTGSSEDNPSLIAENTDPVDLLNMLLGTIPQQKSVDVRDSHQRTPLHYAAAAGTTICCLRLLSRGADINAVDVNGDTPLSLAVRFQRKSVVLLLIQSKASFNVSVVSNNAEDFIPNETEKKVRKIVEWRPVQLSILGKKIGHPERIDLFSGVIKMQWQGLTSLLIDTMIEAGKDIIFDLIASALAAGMYNLVSSLLERAKDKADLCDIIGTKTNKDGRGLMALLALGATDKAAANIPLVLAVAKQLSDFGCTVMARDNFGCTTLHYACLNKHRALVEHFVKGESSAGKKAPRTSLFDNFGRSPIHALFWNLVDLNASKRVKEILPIISKFDEGINLAVDFPPLQHAQPPSSGKCEFVQIDYFQKYPSSSATCLIRSAESSFYELTASVLKAGADVNAKSSTGLTPLMAAVKSNSVECFLVLLSKAIATSVLDEKVECVLMPLYDRLVLKYLKPVSETGFNLTPKEIMDAITKAKEAVNRAKAPRGHVSSFASGGLIAADNDEGVDEDEGEGSGEGDESGSDDEGISSPSPAKRSRTTATQQPVTLKAPEALTKPMPFLLPVDLQLQLNFHRSNRSCEIDYSFLTQIEMPKNERGVDVMAADSTTGNTALHLTALSAYRNTLEMRFMAVALQKMEPRLDALKNKNFLTASDLYKAKQSSSSIANPVRTSSVDVEKIAQEWISAMEKEAEAKRAKEEKENEAARKKKEDKELEPDRRFASHATSKIVRDADSQKPFSAIMTKVDLHASGWSEFNFYQLQLIQIQTTGLYVVFTRWGRIGDEGMYQQTPFKQFKDAEIEFCKIFKQKSGNDWKKLLDGTTAFVNIPKRYRLVTLDRPDRFAQLKSMKIELKGYRQATSLDEESFAVTKVIVDSSLACLNEGRIFQTLQNVHLTPFGLVAPENLKEALRLLHEIGDHVHAVQPRTLSYNEKLAHYTEIGRLSEEYYHIVPRVGFAYSEIYPLYDVNSVANERKKIDLLLNYQASTRLLLAAERTKDKNPCDFVMSAIGMGISRLDFESSEAQDVLQYVAASWQNKGDGKTGVEAIFKLDRPFEENNQAQLGLENRRLLWHGTKLENLLGIFASGLQVSPLGVQRSGSLFGEGIYLSDSFAKSLGYGDFNEGKASFMLLCDVALGMVQLSTDNNLAQSFYTPEARAQDVQCNTSVAPGNFRPDTRFTGTLDDKVAISYGGCTQIADAGKMPYRHGSPQHTEYIVKDPKQIVIKYLIKYWKQ